MHKKVYNTLKESKKLKKHNRSPLKKHIRKASYPLRRKNIFHNNFKISFLRKNLFI